jgi:very-short-patch-repair endonuclease
MLLAPPDPRRVSALLANRLWVRLRLGQIAGFHFSRHHPVGRHIADFYCAEAGVIVQLQSARTSDRGRNAQADQFEIDGYRVVRLSEYELIDDMEGAVQKIGDALRVAPQVTPRNLRYLH